MPLRSFKHPASQSRFSPTERKDGAFADRLRELLSSARYVAGPSLDGQSQRRANGPGEFNEHVEAGIDPRAARREKEARDSMTVAKAHVLYMVAVREGRSSLDGVWSARCAATVRPPRSSWCDLPEEDTRALTDTCMPGFELLRQAGVEYEFWTSPSECPHLASRAARPIFRR